MPKTRRLPAAAAKKAAAKKGANKKGANKKGAAKKSAQKAAKETFSVDTHVFRELGELLVGRDSTALIELIKNAYDADATECTVTAEKLAETTGRITIIDNGLGMTAEQFRQGFLRIAVRTKEVARVSPRFGRRYTGSKGIGRLAAHKLATKIMVESTATDPQTQEKISRIKATIDWNQIEKSRTLDKVPKGAIKIQTLNTASGEPGTKITLCPIRKTWTDDERQAFATDAAIASVPPPLVKLPPILKSALLFRVPRITSLVTGQGWSLHLKGDLNAGDELWAPLAEAADWVLEIRATKGKVSYGVSPTLKFQNRYPDAEIFIFSDIDPDYPVCEFDCRVLLRTTNRWQGRTRTGVRIYQEGFRVPPYGEAGDDWLKLDEEYSNRTRGHNQEIDPLLPAPQTKDDYLIHYTNRHCMGAVFVTLDGASELRSLVSREGFVPGRHLTGITNTVMNGIEIVARANAQATVQTRQDRRNTRQQELPPVNPPVPNLTESASLVSSRLAEAAKSVSTVLEKIRSGNPLTKGQLEAPLVELQKNTTEMTMLVEQSAQSVRDEQAMIRVLASVGTQMAAFVHEIHNVLGLARRLQLDIGRLLKVLGSHNASASLRTIHEDSDRLVRALERQASYLSDIATPDARRRRRRHNLRKCFESAWSMVEPEATQTNIALSNKIPPQIKTGPMFLSEIVAVFANLVTNAVRHAGPSGKIQVVGKALENKVSIRISNTGTAVRLDNAELFFRPFVSTTADVNPTLGQGMGLGLPITRAILAEYGGQISFVAPKAPYTTALEILLPGN